MTEGDFIWEEHYPWTSVRTCATPGIIASIREEPDGWYITWWVGPKGRYRVPSKEKGMRWAERFIAPRQYRLSTSASSGGLRPFDARPMTYEYTPEQAARYDAFSASYVPPKRRARKRR